MGDWYPFLAIRHLLGEMVIYMDSVYTTYPFTFLPQSIFAAEMLKGIKYKIIPDAYSSAHTLIKFNPEVLLDYEKHIQPVFMYAKKPETKEFMKSLLSTGEYDSLIDVIFPEQIYRWKNNENEKIVLHGHPLKIDIPVKEKAYLDSLLSERRIVMHVRNKYGYENIEQYNDLLKRYGGESIVFGNSKDGELHLNGAVDLRDCKVSFNGYMYLSKVAPKFVGSNSVFAYHRLYNGNYDTVIFMPFALGTPNTMFKPTHLVNTFFLNSDKEYSVKEIVRGMKL